MKENTLEQELQELLLKALKERSDSAQEEPQELYVFPLLRRPFFPGMLAHIYIETGHFATVLKKVLKTEHKCIALVMAKEEKKPLSEMTLDDLYDVGVMARVLKVVPQEKGGDQVILQVDKRIAVIGAIENSSGLICEVDYYTDESAESETLKAYSASILSTIKELLQLNPIFKEELQLILNQTDIHDPARLADFGAALTTATGEELQEILATFNLTKRIERALVLLKKELDVALLQSDINKKIEKTINKTQKEYYLREQLKTIRQELGMEKNDKGPDREKFEKRLKERTVPEEAKTVIDEELEKFQALEPQSAEFGVCRNYLDWLTQLPWGVYSEDNLDLDHAEKVLGADHFGLEDIKKRILEFIGVGNLTKGIKGSIICLVGPPGVGKTSVGKSIARALNRKFYRFSVGGMHDEAEIKGHRRTYVGAMPGKLIQALKHCGTQNPVIMLDEVDKIGSNYKGDPASALLEVLDPEQNSDFLDHYLDVRFDLSNVLFILTANVLDAIPEPLKDRMEILRLSGYVSQEKMQIANKYLIPNNRKAMGLKSSQVEIAASALRKIVDQYARESGVRGLEKQLKKILRKVAVDIVRNKTTKQKITTENLIDYLGKPPFNSDRFYEKTPVGVCTGLAWTAMGGATLYIEAMKVKGEKTAMKLTGQAGAVMKESSEIAWSYLQSKLFDYAPEHTFFQNTQVHLHIPEGAIPKDGPSAGITMVTSLLSLLLGIPVKENLGMTGELTLTGRILPIGGVKEKIVAAKRSGLKTLIFPEDNQRDYDELPEYITKGIQTHFVTHYDEVFHLAFPNQETHHDPFSELS
ncbi:MAG: endopeptidase La [Chlamydiia bacterium]|nr:endopeptidase La [Chlamydiia bacterium]